MCLHSQKKPFKCFRQFEKMNSGKIVEQIEEIVSTEKKLYWYFLWYNIKSETMAKINVQHIFAIALALIRSRP